MEVVMEHLKMLAHLSTIWKTCILWSFVPTTSLTSHSRLVQHSSGWRAKRGGGKKQREAKERYRDGQIRFGRKEGSAVPTQPYPPTTQINVDLHHLYANSDGTGLRGDAAGAYPGVRGQTSPSPQDLQE